MKIFLNDLKAKSHRRRRRGGAVLSAYKEFGVWILAQSVKCWLSKHGELSSDAQNLYKDAEVLVPICNSSTVAETGSTSLKVTDQLA